MNEKRVAGAEGAAGSCDARAGPAGQRGDARQGARHGVRAARGPPPADPRARKGSSRAPRARTFIGRPLTSGTEEDPFTILGPRPAGSRGGDDRL